jgi:alkanesulfonate monooxygenase SsuD/methylene tetrahydromethanopterin reductase-like flavin-dependent oxidoreductase (luciferase family)
VKFGLLLPSETPLGGDPVARLNLLRRVTELAGQLGFDSAWALHHHVSNVATFQPLPLLADLAPRVPEMRLGTGVYVLPLHHPVPVAEDVATLDQLTGGRVVFGVAAGYFEPEFEVLGVPLKGRGTRLARQIQALRGLWAGDMVSMEADVFSFRDAQLSLLPVQPGGPPIWIGGVSDVAIRRAVRLADGWLLPPDLDPGALGRRLAVYEQESEAQGGRRLVLGLQRECLLAEDRSEARELGQMYLRQNADVYAERGMPWIRDQFDRWFEGSYLVGAWEDVVPQIQALAQMGVEEIHLRVGWGDCPEEVMLRTVELFGRHVLPLFTSASPT